VGDGTRTAAPAEPASQLNPAKAREQLTTWRAAIVMGIVALVVRLFYTLVIVSQYGLAQESDALYLNGLAKSLAAGTGFTLSGHRIYNQSLGYPLFLSILYRIGGPDVRLALAANACLGALSVALVVLLAGRLQRHVVAAGGPSGGGAPLWGTGLLATLYPDSLLYTPTTSSENLLIPCMLLLLLSALHEGGDWRWGGLTGLTAAAMATVKAHMILACLSLPFLWVLLRVNVWKRLAGATVVGGMCLLPWTWMNFRDSGRFIPFSAIAGTVFFDCTNPYAQGKPTNRFQLPAAEEAGHTEIELNSMRMRRALEYIRSDPKWYLRLLGMKLIYAFSPARDFMFESEGQVRLFTPFLSRWGPTAFNSALLLGAVFGLAALWRTPLACALSLSLLLSSILIQLIFCAFPRYRFPYLFALLPIVAWGWTWAIGAAWVRSGQLLRHRRV
jgi:hypothetical protein